MNNGNCFGVDDHHAGYGYGMAFDGMLQKGMISKKGRNVCNKKHLKLMMKKKKKKKKIEINWRQWNHYKDILCTR